MASLKMKGDLAELKVATDLLERGYKIAIPYGEDWDFDLIFSRANRLERVQVEHATSNGAFITVQVLLPFADQRPREGYEALHRGDDRVASCL